LQKKPPISAKNITATHGHFHGLFVAQPTFQLQHKKKWALAAPIF